MFASIYVIIYVRVAALTDIGGISLFRTGGSGYDCLIGMRQNVLFYLRGIIATRACNVCVPALFGAGGSLCIASYKIMVKRGLFLVGSVFATSTGNVFVPACFSTGGSLLLVNLFVMSEGSYNLGLKNLTALLTFFILRAGLGTACRFLNLPIGRNVNTSPFCINCNILVKRSFKQ